jgi:outer membrane murein-binding lipoprotein Lpp
MPGSGRHRPSRARVALVTVVAVAAAALLGGCAGQEQSGSPAHRVSTWIDGGGGSGIGNVEVASRNVDLVLAKHNSPAAVREACALLSNEAQTSIGNLPAPDDQLTNQLNAAYLVATAAGDDCYHGSSGDARLLARSAAERARTLSLLAVAVQHIESVTGQVPTTETTAPPISGDPFSGNT